MKYIVRSPKIKKNKFNKIEFIIDEEILSFIYKLNFNFYVVKTFNKKNLNFLNSYNCLKKMIDFLNLNLFLKTLYLNLF